MIKGKMQLMGVIVFVLMIISYVEIINGELCSVNCGNGYCCPSSHPLCVQGLPVCCPLGTLFYYNGYCYKSSGKSNINPIPINGTEAARTLI